MGPRVGSPSLVASLMGRDRPGARCSSPLAISQAQGTDVPLCLPGDRTSRGSDATLVHRLKTSAEIFTLLHQVKIIFLGPEKFPDTDWGQLRDWRTLHLTGIWPRRRVNAGPGSLCNRLPILFRGAERKPSLQRLNFAAVGVACHLPIKRCDHAMPGLASSRHRRHHSWPVFGLSARGRSS